MEMKKLDKKSAAVFTNLLKEERYAHFEARSVLLGKKGTGKTTVTRTTHEGEKNRHEINSCVQKYTVVEIICNMKPCDIASRFLIIARLSESNKTTSRRGRMLVGSTTIHAIIAYHHYSFEFESHLCKVYSIQHYVIKFVSDVWHVYGFLWLLRCPPPI
jgi:hypothetical protein